MTEQNEMRKAWLFLGAVLLMIVIGFCLLAGLYFTLVNCPDCGPNGQRRQTEQSIYATNTWVAVRINETETARALTRTPTPTQSIQQATSPAGSTPAQ